MKYNQLGNSDLNISEISFGCMSLNEDNSTNKSVLIQAFHDGINFFDTADLYHQGKNEELIGKTFEGIRNKVIISTKVGNQLNPNGKGWVWNPSKEYILKAVNDSLRRLKTDYIDLYQLHGGTIEDPIDDTIEAFEILKREGKIRYYGISSIRPNVIKEYFKKSDFVSVMMQYSLLDRRPEELLELLHKNNIGVLARGTLAKGLLIDKPSIGYLGYEDSDVTKAAVSLSLIAAELKVSPLSIALRYVLRSHSISSAVVGIRNYEQLKETISASLTKCLSDKEIEYLSNVLEPKKYTLHR